MGRKLRLGTRIGRSYKVLREETFDSERSAVQVVEDGVQFCALWFLLIGTLEEDERKAGWSLRSGGCVLARDCNMLTAAVVHNLSVQDLPHRAVSRQGDRENELVVHRLPYDVVELLRRPYKFGLWVRSTFRLD